MAKTLYTEDHEWLRMESEDVAIVGVTDYAQEQLGVLVHEPTPSSRRNSA